MLVSGRVHPLELTVKAPENVFLEDDPFLLEWPCFQGQTVSFRECTKMVPVKRVWMA